MKREAFDLRNGEVDSWILDEFDESLSLEENVSILCEDMAQIVFPNDLKLHIGWYPSMDTNGCFVVRVIKDHDWENPGFEGETRSFNSLRQIIEQAIEFIKKQSDSPAT